MGLFNKIISTVDVIAKTAELATGILKNNSIENSNSDILSTAESGIQDVRFFFTKDRKIRICNLTENEVVCQFCQTDPTGISRSNFVHVEANGGNKDVTSYFTEYMENGICSITSIESPEKHVGEINESNNVKTLISTLATKTLSLGTSVTLGVLGIKFIPRAKDILVQLPEDLKFQELHVQGSFLLKDKRITFSSDIKPKNSGEITIDYNSGTNIDSIITYADFDVYSSKPDEFVRYLRENNV
ncbi:hypothetical protein [Clostridium brassicae]|uniref:Uncharacterized protein n=1 Tax=Clostridium brassicae TaxID=2999072 RepID=A0ABT4D981_9CLOT|nr:hypothetical protein [Clostridium brassicae]MCY6957751.1 hypothetical protein [Clostridium brassicae]